MAQIIESHVAFAGGAGNAVRLVMDRMLAVGKTFRIEAGVETKHGFLALEMVDSSVNTLY